MDLKIILKHFFLITFQVLFKNVFTQTKYLFIVLIANSLSSF